MTASPTNTSQITAQSTDALFNRYDALGVDEKLALLYYVYDAMGQAITPAAPGAADIELAQPLIEELFGLSEEEQLDAMRSIVRREQTPLSERYGSFSANNQLLVWYAWAEAMGQQVVDMPGDYKASDAVKSILSDIKAMDFQGQISLLREAALHMGYSQVSRPPSQAETGVTNSL